MNVEEGILNVEVIKTIQYSFPLIPQTPNPKLQTNFPYFRKNFWYEGEYDG